MIIALFPNPRKKESLKFAKEVMDYLLSRGVECVMEEEVAKNIGGTPLHGSMKEKVDFSITFGGDGTILRLFHRHPEIQAPIFGINLGGLGFLADVFVSDIYKSLDDLLRGSFDIQERMVLEGFHSASSNRFFAVNDIVIHRGHIASLIEFSLSVGGIYLNTFSADGLIVATPCGSTAYSMAAGGPILTPDLDGIVLTPICPHTLSNRPIVLKPDQEIAMQYLSDYPPVEIIFDGTTRMHLKSKESLTIVSSNVKTFKLVSLHSHDYFTTLRTKLGWSGTLRP